MERRTLLLRGVWLVGARGGQGSSTVEDGDLYMELVVQNLLDQRFGCKWVLLDVFSGESYVIDGATRN